MIVVSKIIVITLAVTHPLVSSLPMLHVPLGPVVILRPVNPNLQARSVDILSMNVTCLNIALERMNFARGMCTKLTGHPARWAKLFVLVALAELILINANCCGDHQGRNLIISAMSKTERGRGMEIAVTTD